MPRTLSQAGLSGPRPYVKTDHLRSQPFYIAGATFIEHGYGGRPQIRFDLQLRDGVYDADGNLHKRVSYTLAATDGQRAELVQYFRTNNDPLGPIIIGEVPTRNGLNPYIQFQDWDATVAMPVRDLPVLDPPKDRDEFVTEGPEDLPF